MIQNKDKELLEHSDLSNLHKKFDNISAAGEEIRLPELDIPARADWWTDAIAAVNSGNQDVMKEVYARLQHGECSPDGKVWWEAILAAAMNAPVYELERMHKTYVDPQQTPNTAYLYIAASELAGKAAMREREKRRAQEQMEQEKLKELQRIADERRAEKTEAEQNLSRHTRN